MLAKEYISVNVDHAQITAGALVYCCSSSNSHTNITKIPHHTPTPTPHTPLISHPIPHIILPSCTCTPHITPPLLTSHPHPSHHNPTPHITSPPLTSHSHPSCHIPIPHITPPLFTTTSPTLDHHPPEEER